MPDISNTYSILDMDLRVLGKLVTFTGCISCDYSGTYVEVEELFDGEQELLKEEDLMVYEEAINADPALLKKIFDNLAEADRLIEASPDA